MRAYTWRVDWWSYVKEVAGDDSTHKISKRMGGKPTPSAIARWRDDEEDPERTGAAPDGQNAARFARAYGRSPVEALVAAGILSAEETEASLADLDEEAILVELLRRVRERKAAGAGDVD